MHFRLIQPTGGPSTFNSSADRLLKRVFIPQLAGPGGVYPTKLDHGDLPITLCHGRPRPSSGVHKEVINLKAAGFRRQVAIIGSFE